MRIAVLTMVLLAVSSLAAAEPRIALLIGNSSYNKEIGRLANPVNDVRLMVSSLRELSFEVLEHTDADQKTMKRAIQDFGHRLEQAGGDAVGLFFYAGHGLQVNGVNYLVPVNAHIQRETDVEIEAVNAEWVLGQMEYARNRINIVILDACRNNPLPRSFRSVARGLARVDAPRGTLIAYSTAPGSISVDGEDGNSPYTKALAKVIKEPGLVAEAVFRKARVEVLAVTEEQQVPWESSSLTGEFYFNKAPRSDDTRACLQSSSDAAFRKSRIEEWRGSMVSLQTRPNTATAGGHNAPGDDNKVEVAFWEAVKDSKDRGAFEEYLKRFPEGNFVGLARLKLKNLSGRARSKGHHVRSRSRRLTPSCSFRNPLSCGSSLWRGA